MLARLLFPVLIFLLNAGLCRELFFVHYSRNMGSIEGAYVSISRYLMENWRDLTWFPLWYSGIPCQNTYPPLLHAIVAGTAAIARISPALSHHAVTAFFYCLGPVGIYFLLHRLGRSPAVAFAGAVIYSLISPSAWLIPAVRADLGAVWGPRRLQTLVGYGDGPHIAALALLPFALLALDVAVSRKRPMDCLLAAVSMAAVALTNWLGAFALAMAVVSCVLSKSRSLRPAAGIAGLAYLLACPWIPPSTIRTIQFNAQTIGGDYRLVYRSLPKYTAIALFVLLLGRYIFTKWKVREPVRFALSFSFLMASITLAAEWAKIYVVPQPERYHLEMDLAFILAVALLFLPYRRRIPPRWGASLLTILGLALAIQCRHVARNWIGEIDIRRTTEFKTAKWFDANMSGRRVMAPGSTCFWMNAFTDTPQLSGGFEQGVVNWENRVAVYISYSGDNAGGRDGEIAALWLKAFGVHAVAVGGPKSGEHYKPFRNPRKFEGLLTEAWRDGDDVIYRVPQRSASLAHVVSGQDLVSRPPIHGLDIEPIQRYVAALENPALPIAGLQWRNRHSAEIVAGMVPEQVLSVQVTYHPGWRAAVNGAARRVFSDGLGFLAIEPKCNGPCRVELVYDGGWEMRAARLLSALSLAGCLAWAGIHRMRLWKQ
jgi:hypothetical protein